MSEAEVKAARPVLAAGTTAHVDGAPSDLTLDLVPGYGGEPARDELSAGVLLEGEPANCVLAFPEELGLQRVECDVELPGEDWTAFTARLERTLTTRYGAANGDARDPYLPRPQEARWGSEDGALSLRAQGPIRGFVPAKVTVSQQTSAWDAATERARRAVGQRAAARAAKRAAEQKAARDAERARLEALQAGDAAP